MHIQLSVALLLSYPDFFTRSTFVLDDFLAQDRIQHSYCRRSSHQSRLTSKLGLTICVTTMNQDIATTRRFPKPTHLYGAVDVFGPNIVSSDGDLWKKYRKISGPSFSEVGSDRL